MAADSTNHLSVTFSQGLTSTSQINTEYHAKWNLGKSNHSRSHSREERKHISHREKPSFPLFAIVSMKSFLDRVVKLFALLIYQLLTFSRIASWLLYQVFVPWLNSCQWRKVLEIILMNIMTVIIIIRGPYNSSKHYFNTLPSKACKLLNSFSTELSLAVSLSPLHLTSSLYWLSSPSQLPHLSASASSLCLFTQSPLIHSLSLINCHQTTEWNHIAIFSFLFHVKCVFSKGIRAEVHIYPSATQTNKQIKFVYLLKSIDSWCTAGGVSVASHCSELMWLQALCKAREGRRGEGEKAGELSRRGKVDVMLRRHHTHVWSLIRHNLLHRDAMCSVTEYFVFIWN